MKAWTREEDPEAVDCTIVIISYNSADRLGVLLESIKPAAEDASVHTIVVDNGSSDDTVAIARSHEGTTCVEAGANLGYSGGINVGRQLAGPSRALLVLNPDLRLEPGSIRRLLDALDEPGVGVAVPRLVDGDGRTLPSLRRDPTIVRAIGDALFGDHVTGRPGWFAVRVHDLSEYDSDRDIEWATGAALMLSAECAEVVGEWDERYFMYSEEVDISLRARQAGFRIRYLQDARVVHFERGSGRSEDLDALRALNQVRLFRRYHGRAATAVLRAIIALHELSRFWKPARRRTARVTLGIDPPPSFPGAAPIQKVPW